MTLFAFTTLIGNYSYCEGCLKFILNREVSKTGLIVFRIIATILVFLGAVATAGLVWDTADMLQGMIVVVNVPSILILGGTAIRCLNDYVKQRKEGKDPHFVAKDIGVKPAMRCLSDYCRQRKEGKDPHFKAADIGLKEDTDFWK